MSVSRQSGTVDASILNHWNGREDAYRCHHVCIAYPLASLISVNAMLVPSLLAQALLNRKYQHLYQHVLV